MNYYENIIFSDNFEMIRDLLFVKSFTKYNLEDLMRHIFFNDLRDKYPNKIKIINEIDDFAKKELYNK